MEIVQRANQKDLSTGLVGYHGEWKERYHLKEHWILSQKLISKVIYHFVKGYPSRKQAVFYPWVTPAYCNNAEETEVCDRILDCVIDSTWLSSKRLPQSTYPWFHSVSAWTLRPCICTWPTRGHHVHWPTQQRSPCRICDASGGHPRRHMPLWLRETSWEILDPVLSWDRDGISSKVHSKLSWCPPNWKVKKNGFLINPCHWELWTPLFKIKIHRAVSE